MSHKWEAIRHLYFMIFLTYHLHNNNYYASGKPKKSIIIIIITDIINTQKNPWLQDSAKKTWYCFVCSWVPFGLQWRGCKFDLVYCKLNTSYCLSILRLQIEALHFNENANKPQRLIKEGEKAGDGQWLVCYPKYKKGGAVAKEIKEACTYSNKLMH